MMSMKLYDVAILNNDGVEVLILVVLLAELE